MKAAQSWLARAHNDPQAEAGALAHDLELSSAMGDAERSDLLVDVAEDYLVGARRRDWGIGNLSLNGGSQSCHRGLGRPALRYLRDMGGEELAIRLLALTTMLQEALDEHGAPPTSDGLRAELAALESMLRKQVEDFQPRLHAVDDIGPDEEHATG